MRDFYMSQRFYEDVLTGNCLSGKTLYTNEQISKDTGFT